MIFWCRRPVLILATAWLSACIHFPNPGLPPALSPLELSENIAPTTPIAASVRPEKHAPNSLWRSGARSLFQDQRAHKVGDILTVTIEIADSAKVNNTTSRSRNNAEGVGLQAFFGLEKKIDGADPAMGFDSSTTLQGTGAVNRAEVIDLTVAAEVVQRLENRNLLILGRQEVRVNNEVRELLISGIIRPEDVAPDNTIAHTQIAQARISYGGRGDLSLVQRPRFGFRVFDKFSPF